MKMMHAFRSVRNHPILPRSFSSSSIAAPVIRKGICSFRSKEFASLSSQQESARIMDRAENPETGDVMYQFGHEYATRCEDEGFGVTHIIKQSVQTAENIETGDVMYQFGHEYATRCEDEGFGVTHSIKQSEKDDTHGSQFGSNVEKKKETPAAEEKAQHRANK